MKLPLLLLLCWACLCSDTWGVEDQPVLILNEESFHESTKAREPLFVYFHIEKCEACDRINPVLKNMSALLKAQQPSIELASVDCDIHPSLLQSEAIRKFPTIRMYSRGTQFDYEGQPYFESLFSWTKRVTGAAVKPLASKDELQTLLQQHSMVLLFTGETGSAEHRLLEQVSNERTEVWFASGSIDGFESGKIILLRNFDLPVVHFEGETTKSGILAWIDSNSSPTVDFFEAETTAKRMFSVVGTKSLVIFTEDMASPEYTAFLAFAPSAAREFVTTRAAFSSEQGLTLFSYLGAEKKDSPDVWIIEKQDFGIKRFRLDEPITEASLQRFIDDCRQGKLFPHLKSQTEPPEQPSEGVFYLVGKNFERLVLQSEESFFVFFFAPHCQHSGLFGPVFDELATRLTAHRDVLKFGVIDGSNNEVHNFDVAGFPSLYLFKAGDKKEPVEYAERRTKKHLLQFLLEELPKDSSTAELISELETILAEHTSQMPQEKRETETDL